MSSSLPPTHMSMPIYNESEFNDLDEVSQSELNFYNTRYVKKSGDTVSGNLSINQNANIAGTLSINNPINVSTFVNPTAINQIGYYWTGSSNTNPTTTVITAGPQYYGNPIPAGQYLFQFSFKLVNTGATSATMTKLSYGLSTSILSFALANNYITDNNSLTITTTAADAPIYNYQAVLTFTTSTYLYSILQATFTGSTLQAQCYTSMTRIA